MGIDKIDEDSSSILNRMRELIALLNRASEAYYKENKEIISNFEYDRLYDELLGLESRLNTVLSGSPTYKVGYEVAESLPKRSMILLCSRLIKPRVKRI